MLRLLKNGSVLIALVMVMTSAVSAQFDPFHIDIDEVEGVTVGSTVAVSIMKTSGTSDPFDGFDLLISYNPDQLNPVSAQMGDLIDNGAVEYFHYRFGLAGDSSDSIYAVRLIGLREDGADPQNPNPAILDNGEIAVINFEVLESAPCVNCQLKFIWLDCGDNSFSVPDLPPGDSIPGYLVSHSVFDYKDLVLTDSMGTLPSFGGFVDSCFYESSPGPSFRYIIYYGGNIKTDGCDQITWRGDININGVPYEAADALIFANYFMIGLGAFTIDLPQQIANCDVNADGITLSMADFVTLLRVNEGYLPPASRADLNDITGDIIITDTDTSLIITTDFDGWIGGFLMNFSMAGVTDYELDILDDADHLTLLTNDDNDQLSFMLYRLRQFGEPYHSAAIDSGFQFVAELLYEGTSPTFGDAILTGFAGEHVDYSVQFTEYQNSPPVFGSYPSTLSNDSANIFFYDFEAIDPDGDQVLYRLINGVGTLDSLTGIYSFGPVCCELDSVLNIEICAEDALHPCPQSDPALHATFNLIVDNAPPPVGDVNNNGEINVLDIIELIDYKFMDGPMPVPLENSDVNRNGVVEIVDIILLIDFKFQQGQQPGCF